MTRLATPINRHHSFGHSNVDSKYLNARYLGVQPRSDPGSRGVARGTNITRHNVF